MSSFTLSGIRDRILVDKLDDDQFDPGVVDNFINDTVRDVFSEYELSFMEKIYSGTIPTGVTMFSLPDDVSLIESQVITGPDGSQKDLADFYLPFREFNKLYKTPGNNQAGSVTYWTSFGGKMILCRPTNADYTLNIFYIKKPTKLVLETAVPEIPEEFEEMVVLGAFSRVQDREGDTDEALVTQQKYQRKLEQLVNRYGQRHTSKVMKMGNRQVGR